MKTLVENRLSVLGFSPGQAIFGPGTKDRISPGWSNQPGLKSPAQRLEAQLLQEGSRREPLVSVRGSNRD